MSSCGVEPEAQMPRKLKFDKSRRCIKCKELVGSIVIRHAVYCKACFLSFVTYKFRRCLEPSISPSGRRTDLNASGNLLIGFSGGLGSTVMLDLVSKAYFSPERMASPETGSQDPRKGPVWSQGFICYVDICSAFPGMPDRTGEIRKAVEGVHALEFMSLRVENAFDWDWWESISGRATAARAMRNLGIDMSSGGLFLSDNDLSSDPKTRLRSYLSSLPTATAIHATIRTLTRLLLLHAALSVQASHLLLGTSLTSLSINLISGMAQGEGFVLREEVEEEWTGPSEGGPKIKICKPMRDVGMKECAAYAWWTSLHIVGKEKVPGVKDGIAGLTEDFIVALERDYPSTVSTIARTCGKLAPKDESDGHCVLCQRPVQRGVQEWKARISILSLSDTPPPSNPSDPPSLTPHLCYACHTTLTSRSNRRAGAYTDDRMEVAGITQVEMPVWVGATFGGAADEVWKRRRMDMGEMKESVQEYLLGD